MATQEADQVVETLQPAQDLPEPEATLPPLPPVEPPAEEAAPAPELEPARGPVPYMPPDNTVPANIVIKATVDPLRFGLQVIAAGLTDVIAGWTPEAVELRPDATSAQRTAVMKVIKAHDPIGMPDRRQAAFAAAMSYGNGITATVTKQYADVEVQSWTAQEAEARTVLGGGALSDTAMLPHLASDRGIDLAAYAQSVIEKADAYRMIAVAAVRLRRGAEGLLSEKIDTPEALDAAVEALRAETLAAAKAVGIEI